MARVKYFLRTKNNPSNIYLRFYHSKDFDLTTKTGFLINPKFWSNKQQRIKTTSNSPLHQIINPKLSELREKIIEEYNLNHISGNSVNKTWLENIIAEFNNQPTSDADNPKYYLVPLFEEFIQKSKNRINPRTNKKISSKTISKYITTKNTLEEFEIYTSTKTKLTELDFNFHDALVSFLSNERLYNGTTIEKFINTIKSAVKYGKTNGYDISNEIDDKNFTYKREETYDTYLNESEIHKIFILNLKNDKALSIARDWLIIGLWTGLRVSDLMRLNKMNIDLERMVFTNITTQKTNQKIELPIHQQIQEVLNKRNGEFPPKISEQHFNEKIKKVCAKADIDKKIKGKKKIEIKLPNGEKTFRKKLDYYPKHQLISSHTCRRSFATNHYSKIPNRTIMAMTGHKSEAQFEKYLKQSQAEHIETLKNYWNKSTNLS